MKRWYDKYLAAYNKPFGEVSEALHNEVNSLPNESPIVLCHSDCHNEG